MRKPMRVVNEYADPLGVRGGGHHYVETWEPDDYHYCPCCGEKGKLWTATTGDYYVGEETVCTGCNHKMLLLGGPRPATESNTRGIIEQLRTGIPMKPTTRRGT